MCNDKIHRYILTGGPGSGKSTLLRALGEQGYVCSEEVSRQLIMEELENGRDGCLPWENLAGFTEKALTRMVEAYHEAGAHGGDRTQGRNAIEPAGPVAFFDRGIPDIIAYLRDAGIPVREHFHTIMQLHPYEKTVFLLPPWQDIYVQDPARWQTYEESERLCQGIRRVYESAGYKIMELSPAPVEERVRVILNLIKTKTIF